MDIDNPGMVGKPRFRRVGVAAGVGVVAGVESSAVDKLPDANSAASSHIKVLKALRREKQ
jgi:hypothetical protein